MKESIKKRIEAVRRGEVPEGYRIANGYLIPKDWKTVLLNSRFTRATRKNSTGCEKVLTISAQMGLVNQREFYDKDIASEDKSGYFLMKNGEFAYNKSYSTGYPYGAIKQLTRYDEGIVSPLYICFAPKAGTNTAFYTQYFEGGRYNREIYRVAQEGARNHGLLNIAVEDFFTGTLVEPSAGEQQKIAEILATCDRMIELKQRKIDELKKLKQVCLLEMFPQKGQTIPKRRFPGFSAPWEQRKLGEVIRLNGRIGFRGYTEKDIVSKDDGGVLTFSPTNIVDNKLTTNCKNTYITRFKYDESPEIKIHNGDILFVKTGSTLGKSALVTGLSEDATLNPQVVVMRANNLNVEFLAALLVTKAIISQVNSAKIGGAVPTLTETRIKDFDVAIPVSEAEKEQIGQFFSKLDHLITLHQRELAEVGKYKKALMQLLLTGLVRVNA